MTARTLIIALLALALVAVAVFASHSASRASYSDEDPAYNSTYWKERIAKDGAKSAYGEFKERNQKAPYARQHLSAHVMGELIYEAEGVAAIAACDADFGFGCYHGFFGRAVSEGGDTRVKELDAACVAAYGSLGTGCQHGIGHGILEYVGYDRVNDALALCSQTTEPSPLLGCASGVFMEYNAPLVGAGAGLAPSSRSLEEATIYEPCDTAPVAYQESCYYQLGQWLAPKLPNDLAKVGSVCAGLSGANSARCFMGAGEGVTYTERNDRSAARDACATFAKGEDERSCSAGVSWALFANGSRAEAAAACAYPDEAATKRCLALSDLTGGLDPH